MKASAARLRVSAWRLAAAAMIGFKLWLVAAQPIFAIPGASIDDGLFAKLARHLLAGEWLGSYDALTLAKGPAYSFFIAAAHFARVPLPIAQHLLHIVALGALVQALRPLLPRVWAFVLFTLLLWNPMSYEMAVLGRVLRQHLYTPAAVLVLAGLIALHTRATAPALARAGWALLLGLSASCMWLTREETIWIAPTAILIATAGVFSARGNHLSWQKTLWPIPLAIATAMLPVALVTSLNARYYGWRGTVEFHAPEYVSAYGALSRVIPPDSPIPLVPVTRATRELLYAISSSFAELKAHLEGDVGAWAATASSPFTHLDPNRLEIAGGWWMWALRDSVARAGHASSARTNLDFYHQLAAEINAACDTGKVPALPRRDTLAPVWHPFYFPKAREEAWPFVRYFVSFDGFTAHTPNSQGDAESLRLFTELTRWRHSPPADHEISAPLPRHTAGRINFLQSVGSAFAHLNTLAILAGVIAWAASIVAAVWKRRPPPYLWWVSTGAWGATASSLAITFFIHVTSFPTLNPGYFSHAYPCAILAAVTSVAACSAGLKISRMKFSGAATAVR